MDADEMRSELDRLKARVRILEQRLTAQGLRTSNKSGETKIVRLDKAGTGLEAD